MKIFHCINKITESIQTAAGRFRPARSGTVAVIFGLAFLPLMLMMGVAVDFGRAATTKSRLQAAADSAVLAAGARSSATQSVRRQVAQNLVAANLGPTLNGQTVQVIALPAPVAPATAGVCPASSGLTVCVSETEPSAGTYQVRVNASIQTTVMKIAHIDSLSLSANSEAKNIGVSSDQPLEIALALDNTGSMKDDMPSLISAAKNLAQTVMGASSGGAVKVSVVPYVAAVNPGLTDLSMVDTAANAPFTGDWFKGGWIAYHYNCPMNWGSGGGSGGAGGGGSGDANDLIELLNPFRRIARELFGVASAHAADVTPNTIAPLTLQDMTSTAKTNPGNNKKTYKVPVGFGASWNTGTDSGRCDWLTNPSIVSNYELFNRVRNTSGGAVAWKGCVEARASKAELDSVYGANAAHKDYDVTDEAPSAANTKSLFTPYFAPDEPDYSVLRWAYVAPGPYVAANQGFHNNYQSDGSIPSSGANPSASNWGWTLETGGWSGENILKYNGATNSAIITETGGGRTYGPNAGCPDPVLRLTNNQSQVVSKIDALTYWDNGGTIVSEGLMWAWRTLSPNAPYADGKAYGTTGLKKVIVLMTDGVNMLNDNGDRANTRDTSHISEYSAYGYLGSDRLYWNNNVQTFAQATTHLDNRLTTACANAKASGVKIYTVLFSAYLTAAQKTASEALLGSCASQASYAYSASDASGLNTAFSNIASSAVASPLHLTK
jgi:Flp pilus assembly protein TadG